MAGASYVSCDEPLDGIGAELPTAGTGEDRIGWPSAAFRQPSPEGSVSRVPMIDSVALCVGAGKSVCAFCVVQFCNKLVNYVASNYAAMSSPPFPSGLELAKRNMLEARKPLDEYEVAHGYGGSPELQRLEREFSKATETYLRILDEER